MAVDTTNDDKPKRKRGPVQFFTEVRAEAKKVTWATRKEVQISTVMVLIMVALASVFFFVVDSLLRLIVQFLLGIVG